MIGILSSLTEVLNLQCELFLLPVHTAELGRYCMMTLFL